MPIRYYCDRRFLWKRRRRGAFDEIFKEDEGGVYQYSRASADTIVRSSSTARVIQAKTRTGLGRLAKGLQKLRVNVFAAPNDVAAAGTKASMAIAAKVKPANLV